MPSEEIEFKIDGVVLEGSLNLPIHTRGLVLFAHGSGSSRLSPRNQQVAKVLNDAELGTFLFDLLTEEESEDRSFVFNIPFLAKRLNLTVEWLKKHKNVNHNIGYFGASTGAGAALWSAADLGDQIRAVVSRGGRPDLAHPRLHEVKAPTLLIVGERDSPVIHLNKKAKQEIPQAELKIIPEATHLFEEPGKLKEVALLAKNWFLKYLI